MDPAKLIKARQYYDRTMGGEDRKEVALALYSQGNFKAIESSKEYLAIVSAASQLERMELKREVEEVKRKHIKSYSKLLDKGEELLDSAETIEEKFAAQANQRANLEATVLDKALAWNGDDRNQNDLGDILEGIIV